jgi:hypothetical protein
MDIDLLELLMINSDKIININLEFSNKIKNWWENNLENTTDEKKITSTEIWIKFKKENKEYILDNKITIEQFKEAITSLLDNSKYIEKTKKSAIEFIGYKFKNEIIEKEKKLLNTKIKKIQTEIKTEILNKFYLSEEQDKKIINEYDNFSNNIISISEINNIRPWQVVSLLMRHKIIMKREDARGYNLYKESDEYKDKIKSKN